MMQGMVGISSPLLRLAILCLLAMAGCGPGAGQLDQIWGKKGIYPGEFIRPRAIACDRRSGQERVYVVDFTGRVQAFTPDGHYLLGWKTPAIANGRPAGVGIAPNGNVLIADSHYHRLLIYSSQGELLHTLEGIAPSGSTFAYVADVEQDKDGNLYVTVFGDDQDVIRKLSPEGKLLGEWGGRGSEPGKLARPRGMALSEKGELYVADSCNHRIQVYDLQGKLLRCWGHNGSDPGQLNYPYDVALGPDNGVYVVEFGNHRVQRFSPTGEPRGVWGGPGRGEPGRLHNPWGLAVDARGRLHVTDTENHRVQRVSF